MQWPDRIGQTNWSETIAGLISLRKNRSLGLHAFDAGPRSFFADDRVLPRLPAAGTAVEQPTGYGLGGVISRHGDHV